MRKTIAAVSVGLLLVAGQAAAAGSNTAAARVADRVGGSTSTQWAMGAGAFSIIPVVVIIGSALAFYSISTDDKGSDA